jgi:hypothetical protein
MENQNHELQGIRKADEGKILYTCKECQITETIQLPGIINHKKHKMLVVNQYTDPE